MHTFHFTINTPGMSKYINRESISMLKILMVIRRKVKFRDVYPL